MSEHSSVAMIESTKWQMRNDNEFRAASRGKEVSTAEKTFLFLYANSDSSDNHPKRVGKTFRQLTQVPRKFCLYLRRLSSGLLAAIFVCLPRRHSLHFSLKIKLDALPSMTLALLAHVESVLEQFISISLSSLKSPSVTQSKRN